MKGSLYLRGPLLDGRQKSMQPMAGRLGVDHQQSQQFMTSSAWQVDTVRTRLARRAVAVVRPQVRVVYDTGFPKGGTASPGVSRQHSGTLGKVGNWPDRGRCPCGVRHRFVPVAQAVVPARRAGTAPRPPAVGTAAGFWRRNVTGRSGSSHWTCSTK
ncbi:transposase [Streptomyces sp. NPDC006641]|uniref:transposase n=1 Tax=unclassified Streptomyces TaxID=2593676 RepID=UPI0036B23FF2